jgi:hydroxymethylglutaryl-CoA reductase (NADPH)
LTFSEFLPGKCACLIVTLQLSRSGETGQPAWQDKSLIMRALHEEDQKPNPVVQRVKVIMSAGLMLVHAHRYDRYALPPHRLSNVVSVLP